MNDQAKPIGSTRRAVAYATFGITVSLVGLAGLALTGAITGFVWGVVTKRPFPPLVDHPLWFLLCAPAVLATGWFIVRFSDWMKKRGWW